MTETDEPGPDEASPGVGFIGLGNIGGPMAKRLLGWPGGLTVFDVRTESMGRLVAKGARAAVSPADVARHSQVISVMVLDDNQVREVLTGPEGIFTTAQPGTVVAIHSTISADTAIDLAAQGEVIGVGVVDAPVSGGSMGAHGGTLAVMVGGSVDAVDTCRGPFGAWAGLVAHLGPIGAGTKTKLARNLLHFVSFTAVAEACRLAEAAGVDLALLGEVVRHSDAITGGPGAIMLRDTTEPLEPSDGLFDIFTHTRNLGEKDLNHALKLGVELGVDLPLARLAVDRLAAALGVPTRRSQTIKRHGAVMTDEDPRRQRGKDMMKQVYGWDIGDIQGDFVELTVDHLFGEVWANGNLSVRERRMLLIGLLVGSGLDDVVGLQLDCALNIGELDESELREMVVFLAHYAGWPRAAKFNQIVEEQVAKRAKAARHAARDADGS